MLKAECITQNASAYVSAEADRYSVNWHGTPGAVSAKAIPLDFSPGLHKKAISSQKNNQVISFKCIQNLDNVPFFLHLP